MNRTVIGIILITITAVNCTRMFSNSQITMMIALENPKQKNEEKNGKRNPDHTYLRNKYKIQKMSEQEKRLFDLEMELKRKKLNQGDERIKDLRKILEKVKVYRTFKEIKKHKKKVDLLEVKYNDDMSAKIIKRIRDEGKKESKGKSLDDLVKEAKKNKKNPFEEMVVVQGVIDRAQEPEKEKKEEEKIEIREMLKKRGLKALLEKKKGSNKSN